MWSDSANPLDSCFDSTAGATNPALAKSTYTSAVFKDMDYAVNACPQSYKVCGARLV